MSLRKCQYPIHYLFPKQLKKETLSGQSRQQWYHLMDRCLPCLQFIRPSTPTVNIEHAVCWSWRLWLRLLLEFLLQFLPQSLANLGIWIWVFNWGFCQPWSWDACVHAMRGDLNFIFSSMRYILAWESPYLGRLFQHIFLHLVYFFVFALNTI